MAPRGGNAPEVTLLLPLLLSLLLLLRGALLLLLVGVTVTSQSVS